MEQPKVIFTATKQEVIDKKLEEISFHQKKIEELNGQLNDIVLDRSDSELRDEQQYAKQFIQNIADNPIAKKIHDEEIELEKVKVELNELTQ